MNLPLVGFFISVCISLAACLQCLDGKGGKIDWFSVYKVPSLHKVKNFDHGFGFVYLDNQNPQWQVSNTSINEPGNAVYNTLQQVYTSKGDSIMYIMYNDETPTGKFQRGHTKGVIAFDGTAGFWMLHSSPKFPPPRNEKYDWSATTFGQTVLCISLPYKEIGNVAQQLLYNEAEVYDSVIPPAMSAEFPVLGQVVRMSRAPGLSNIRTLTSLAGQTFVSFAKSRHFGADLYDDLVAPYLQSNLLVETWLRSKGEILPSNCSAQYKVYKVSHITLPGKLAFYESKDHSKWAVTYAQDSTQLDSTYWTCIGDINRMKSQFYRGGGTVCLKNKSVWKSFRAAIDGFEHCKKV